MTRFKGRTVKMFTMYSVNNQGMCNPWTDTTGRFAPRLPVTNRKMCRDPWRLDSPSYQYLVSSRNKSYSLTKYFKNTSDKRIPTGQGIPRLDTVASI